MYLKISNLEDKVVIISDVIFELQIKTDKKKTIDCYCI